MTSVVVGQKGGWSREAGVMTSVVNGPECNDQCSVW